MSSGSAEKSDKEAGRPGAEADDAAPMTGALSGAKDRADPSDGATPAADTPGGTTPDVDAPDGDTPDNEKTRRRWGRGKRSKAKPPRRRRWLLRGLLTVAFQLGFIAALIGGAIWWLTDRPVTAPDWLRARIEARIAQNAPGLDVDFGQMVLTVHQGWRPTAQLRDVVISSAEGAELMALSEMNASLAFRPLLEGLVQPKTARLSGLFATLRRDSNGVLSLQVSPDAAPVQSAASLPEMVEQLDGLFQSPGLAALTELDLDAVTLRFEDARARRAWTVDGARVRIRREGEELRMAADLALLGGGASVATLEANYTSRIGESTAQFGVSVRDVRARDLAAISPAFGWLTGLQAPISGAVRSAVDAGGNVQPVNATLQIGQGVLQPAPQTRAIPFNAGRTYLTFHPDLGEIVFDLIEIDSPWLSGTAEGHAQLVGLDEGRLDEMIGQFNLNGLTFSPPDLYETPLQLDRVEMDTRFIPDPFRVELGQMRIRDQGEIIWADGALDVAPEGWRLALDARMARLNGARLLELWPVSFAGKPRDWVSKNITGGNVSDLQFALRSSPGVRPDMHLGFGFTAQEVRYHKTLPPLKDTAGVASLLRDRFVVALDQGYASVGENGRVDAAGSAFIIPDVTAQPDTPAVIRIKTDSTINAALAVLDQPPLEFMRKANLPVTLAEGRAELTGTLALPIRKSVAPDEIDYAFEGRLTDVVSDVLVPGRRLEAEALTLDVSPREVRIGGPGQFDGIAFEGDWTMVPGTPGSRVVAQMDLSQNTVERLKIGLPPGTVSGRGGARLVLDLPAGRAPQFEATSDLRGVGLSVPALGWSKPAASRGNLTVAGTLGASPAIDRLALAASGLDAEGRVALRQDGGLDRAEFSSVKLGGWLSAPVALVGRGQGAAPAVIVQGGTLDMRRASFGGRSGAGGGGGNAQTGPLTLRLDRLQITDTIALTGLNGDFTLNRGLEGKFRGRVNGVAQVSGTVVPEAGRSAFRITSGDAGKVFASAGLLKQARGGDMQLILRPVGTAGAFNGALSITNTRVQDAPAIAALFNALSVVGLLEQMGGQGLHFAEVEAAFRLTPERVTLTEASAVGPSIGLSMDGTYDLGAGQMDMRGVFSPIYLINGVGSLLTRKGEGLIGFNFRLSGPSDSPRVQVNPLSALTPSIFRELFRRPAPSVAQEPGEAPGAQPRVQGNTGTEETGKAPLEHGGGER
ncbi:hypothetical protein E4Z66_01825 [Aliishimia ponticola]|uniref:DUF3971 domain-containing protein n=1 Tax=Aliishimia ponticola TaxID=2499833 RepID=A0A4S4NFH5_9RHOB|nr:AsmA-like C-terminal region-containing protein [Aliishimia ponticola]THH38334.1 hypothetical protein E4Z66_01825 [Aliishimia ponticola]